MQQLVRYYNVIQASETLPFEVAMREPRLIAIAPHFHADTLTDCQYSTLKVELITFALETSKNGQLSLVLSDTAGKKLSSLSLPKTPLAKQPDIAIPEPPRKLLNWLSHSSEAEYDWVMQMRAQILSFDPRMKEVVTASSIFYGRGKTKACCELRKVGSAGYIGRALSYFLWLPHLERKPQVMRMMVGFEMKQQRLLGLAHSRSSYRTGEGWSFPGSVKLLQNMGYPQFREYYEPLLNAGRTIRSSHVVDLALQTWHNKL